MAPEAKRRAVETYPALIFAIVLLTSPVWLNVGMYLLSRYERNLSRPFVPARKNFSIGGGAGGDPRVLQYTSSLPDASQASRYLARMSADLRDAGFEFGEVVASVKPLIQWLGAVWWTPGRDVVALTGSGTVAKLGTSQTWLISRLRDGRYLVTTDFPESDLSGVSVISRMLNVRMPTLLRRHRKRMARRAAELVIFDDERAYDAVDAFFRARLDHLLSRGLARYAGGGDDEQNRAWWVYTPVGAILMCGVLWKMSMVALFQFWRYFNPRWVWRRALAPIGTDRLVAVAVAPVAEPTTP